MIGLEPKLFVGLNRIASLVLQFVSLEFGHQADAPPLLHFVDQNPSAGLSDHGERHLQLLAAIAAQGAEDVAGEALRMDANQRRLSVNVAHDQGYGFFHTAVAIKKAFKSHNAELSPASGEIGLSHLADGGISTHESHYRHAHSRHAL